MYKDLCLKSSTFPKKETVCAKGSVANRQFIHSFIHFISHSVNPKGLENPPDTEQVKYKIKPIYKLITGKNRINNEYLVKY